MRKKVLHLRSTDILGGAETVMLELSKELPALGFTSMIGVLDNPRKPNATLAEAAQRYEIPIQRFECGSQLDFNAISDIRKFVHDQGIEIVHAHGYKPRFYTLASCSREKTVRFTTCHLWQNYNFKQGMYIKLDKFLLNRFDQVVAVSEPIREEISEVNIHESKISVVENCIDVERFNGGHRKNVIREKFGLPKDKIIIGSIGRLMPQKGFDIFLDAANGLVQKNSKLFFVIVGDGPLRRELEMQISRLGLENKIAMLGERNEIPELLTAFDLFIMSSRDEGIPMVLLEAMAAQKPVVATRVGGIPWVIKDGETGLLVEPNVEQLQNKVSELLLDKNKARRLAQSARKRIMEDFSSKTMAEKYAQLYERTLTEQARN